MKNEITANPKQAISTKLQTYRPAWIFIFRVICVVLASGIFVSCTSNAPEDSETGSVNVYITEAAQTDSPAPSTFTNQSSDSLPASEAQFKYNIYSVTCEINPTESTIIGTENITYVNHTGVELDSIKLKLFLNATKQSASTKPYFKYFSSYITQNGMMDYGEMLINNVYLDNDESDFSLEYDDTILDIPLSDPLLPNEQINIGIHFSAKIPHINYRIGMNNRTMWMGSFFPSVCVYTENGFDLNPFYPAGEPFYINLANYIIEVITPKNYVVSGTGSEDRISFEADSDKVKTILKAEIVRDFAFMVAEDTSKIATQKTRTGTYVNIYSYETEISPDFTAIVADTVDYFEQYISSYPYQSIDISDIPLYDKEGIGYPQFIMLDMQSISTHRFKETVVPLIVQQWFKNSVGYNPYKSSWIYEGLSHYLALKYLYPNEGDLRSKINEMYTNLQDVLPNLNQKTPIMGLAAYETWQNYYEVHIVRSTIFFYALEQIMDNENFNKFVKQYYERNKNSITGIAEMSTLISELRGIDTSSFIDLWLTEKTLPRITGIK